MIIVYCDSVIDHKKVDPDYEAERKATIDAGFKTAVISYEYLTEGNVHTATRHVETQPTMVIGIYRGWMLTPNQYKNLHYYLALRNIRLINFPEEYKHCHYLPESYSKIEAVTPLSKWTKDLTPSTILRLASCFGSHPIIVKDFVKSEKHHWHEACFIADASDSDQVKASVARFLELRGKSLNEGLVFRKFEPLEHLTNHSRSGMPLTKEFRIFFANNQVLAIFNYWDEGVYGETQPELAQFIEIGKSIDSHFFTMDIAQKTDGNWIIMELGDGQVAGLPSNADKDEFYHSLHHILSNTPT